MRREYKRLRALRDAQNVRIEADEGLRVQYTIDGQEHCMVLQ